jgi:ABC-type uncharacterized transport system involved in gliding motility auxiliary subunit
MINSIIIPSYKPNNISFMEYTISAFVDKLIQEKNIHGLSDEVMIQIKNDLVERAENIINANILANMPEEFLEEFEKKLDEGNDEEIQLFCRKHISNIDQIIADSLFKLQKIYLKDTLK